MPKCYMLVGLPGVGKSTLSAKMLEENPKLIIVSTDQYVEDYAKKHNKKYNEVIRETSEDAKKWMSLQIKKTINLKLDFIWDQTNVISSSRKKKISMLSQNKYDIIALVFELSDDELNKRLTKRLSQNGKKIPQKIIENMKQEYTRPSYSEGFLEIYLVQPSNDLELIQKINFKNKQ
jgi:predicted kinase